MTRTLAQMLGGTPHLSPLLHKARRLGLATPEDLLRLAVRRGCTHYMPPDYTPAAVTEPGRERLSDLELAIALCSAAQAYEPRLVRCATQLLGAPGIEPRPLARLARMERCAPVVRHIAEAACVHDEGRQAFWRDVLAHLPSSRPVPPGVLPHASRFMLQTGLGDPLHPRQPRAIWLRPRLSSHDQ